MNKVAFVLTGARTPSARMLLTVLFGIMLGVSVFLATGCSDDEDTIQFPTPPEPQALNWLFDVYGTGPNDVYACGNKGAMFHFDGSTWTYMDMGVTSAIVTVWENDGTMYAVGHGGRIWRNSSGQWNSMDSGTGKDLYGIGVFDGAVYACGAEGTLRKLNGSSWGTTPEEIVIRDPSNNAPTDTLSRRTDLASLLTVNNYFIGGAYKKPDYNGEEIGLLGTDGMVMTTDPEYDWLLRPIRGDQLAVAEWVLSTTSSATVLERNFLGTSEGWIFQLSEEDDGDLVWVKHYPRVAIDPGSGIRDLWLDENSNVYMVTDDGQLVIQSSDYDFNESTGFRKVLYDQINALVGIWGTGSDNFYMVGFVENKLFQAAMDFSDTTLVGPVEIMVDFPDKGTGIGLFEDELGRSRF